MTDMHEAAFRAGLWQVIEQRAKELKDAAKQELQALGVGDTVAGRYDGQVVAKATMTRGRAKLVITDEREFYNWLMGHHPTEVVTQVNPAFFRFLESKAKELGTAIGPDGEVVPGVEWVEGDPYVTVRRAPEAAFVVAQLLSSGRLSLEGVKELNA